MSKQSEAKEAQGYTQQGTSCANCANFTSEMKPLPWMVRNNAEIDAGTAPKWATKFNLELLANQKETNPRCAVGGFTVKKSACCNIYERKEAA